MTTDNDLTRQAILAQGVNSLSTTWNEAQQQWIAIAYGRKVPMQIQDSGEDVTVAKVLCQGTGSTEDGALEQLLTSVSIHKKASPQDYEETDGGTAEMDQQVEGDTEQEISTTGSAASKEDRG